MRGIVTGCDSTLECLLPWWWEHYAKSNDYPVTFVDFGLSKQGRQWCTHKGIYLLFPDSFPVDSCKEIPEKERQIWEKLYGRGVWLMRSNWFKKPFACLLAPFVQNLWIDIDCRVEGSLEPLFQILSLGIEIAISKESEERQKMLQEVCCLQPENISYNSGVIAFQSKSPTIQKWADLIQAVPERFPGDQEALSSAIFLQKPSLFELPSIYNWSWTFPANKNALITHFHGQGKIEIVERMQKK